MSELKNAFTSYLRKEGKYPKDVRSYRPVALTNIIGKIFEKMTNKRQVWYLEKERKIDDRQFSFRKQRNTKTKILHGFRRKEKTAIFLYREILLY